MSEPTPLDRELGDRVRRYLPEQDAPMAATLAQALGRGRRLRRRRQIAAAAAICAVAVAIPVTAVIAAGALRDGRQQVQPADVTRLLGTFSHTVSAPAPPAVRGRWTLTFRGNDIVTVDAPVGYRGVTSGVAYSATGATLRINLFVQDRCVGQPVGRYTWTRTDTGLSLIPISDTCPARRAVLTSNNWQPGQ